MQSILLFQDGPEDAKAAKNAAENSGFVLLWGRFFHFGVTLGFGVTLTSLWADRSRMALVMPIVPPCVWPRRVHKQEIHINAKYFARP